MAELKMFMAICTECEGWAARACADDAVELDDAQREARRWEARGDVAVVVTYDPAVTPKCPIPQCRCPLPRAHIKRPQTKADWVPIYDGRPDSDETVLIAYLDDGDDEVFMGYHDGEKWVDVSGMPVHGMTHWANLPEPPPF